MGMFDLRFLRQFFKSSTSTHQPFSFSWGGSLSFMISGMRTLIASVASSPYPLYFFIFFSFDDVLCFRPSQSCLLSIHESVEPPRNNNVNKRPKTT